MIKEKWDSAIKERTCANGRMQHVCKTKEELASLIPYTDLVLLTTIIDVHKKCDITIVDIKGAYLK